MVGDKDVEGLSSSAKPNSDPNEETLNKSITAIFESLKAKTEEQNYLISLMQAQIDVQREQLAKQEKLIEELTLQVKELQMKEIERNCTEEKISKEQTRNNDWTTGSLGKNGSLAEIVKEAAEQTMAQSGFVYDENSKLYYDYSSGYYYDPVQSLYYNGHTRTYYSYNEETKEYVFHSQLSPLPSPSSNKPIKDDVQFLRKTKRIKVKVRQASSHKIKDEKKSEPGQTNAAGQEKIQFKPIQIKSITKSTRKVKAVDEIEDGEISSSSSSSQSRSKTMDEEDSLVVEISDSGSDSEYSVRELEPAPCIRAIVTESTVSKLRKGFLFLVTCTGGSIGREGSEHAILLSDTNVSKRHAKITYGTEEPEYIKCDSDSDDEKLPPKQSKYLISDLGSQNGTFLNGKRLSESKMRSELFEIQHGSTLEVGGTKLLLHIHSGMRTCGHCEPGLIMEKEPLYGPVQNKAEKEAIRKGELKKLRRKYGIEHPAVQARQDLPTKYVDRAERRRVMHGSDNPFEKTSVASIDEAIKPDNKGYRMMAKMGWSVGKTLGQTGGSGIHEPIKIKFKQGRGGLGSDEVVTGPVNHLAVSHRKTKSSSEFTRHGHTKSQLLKKTRKRFNQYSSAASSDVPEFTID